MATAASWLLPRSQRTHQQLQAVEGTLLDSLVLLKDIVTARLFREMFSELVQACDKIVKDPTARHDKEGHCVFRSRCSFPSVLHIANIAVFAQSDVLDLCS